MAYHINFSVTLYLDFETEVEEENAKDTIKTFCINNSGEYSWKGNKNRSGKVDGECVIFLPVADRTEVHTKCNTIESNLDALPRTGACVKEIRINMTQAGLPE
jgi:hypothetical protein